jgi:hypothetical protein
MFSKMQQLENQQIYELPDGGETTGDLQEGQVKMCLPHPTAAPQMLL